MTELLAVTSVLIVMGVMLPAAYRQYRTDRTKFIGSIKAGAVYLVYCFIGIALMLTIMTGPQSESKVTAGMAFFLSWVLYGVLWLMRLAPRYREIPAWIDKRNSVLDYAFWVIIGLTLLAALVS
jgi:hypothetical protein